MTIRKFFRNIWVDAITLVVVIILFIVPFLFLILTAAKTSKEAAYPDRGQDKQGGRSFRLHLAQRVSTV
jgi:ABC-type glycerol-3-phosphate transport system permease component